MIATIYFLCAFIGIVVVWTLLFFNIENDIYNYILIIIFIVIVPGVNRPLDYFLTILNVYLTVSVCFFLQLRIARYKLYIALYYLVFI